MIISIKTDCLKRCPANTVMSYLVSAAMYQNRVIIPDFLRTSAKKAVFYNIPARS